MSRALFSAALLSEGERTEGKSKCWVGIREIGARWTVRGHAILAPEAGDQKTQEGCYPVDRQQEKHSGKGEQLMHASGTLHNTLRKTGVDSGCQCMGQMAGTKLTP